MTADDDRVVTGRAAVVALWRERLLALSQPAAPRELRWHDASFDGWPLDEPAVLDSLAAWLRPRGRRLLVLGQDFEAVARRHPRFARWRRDWVHAIEVFQPVQPGREALPSLWLEPALAIERLDGEPWRARVFADAAPVQAWWAFSAALLQGAEPAWPANVAGL